MNYAVEWPKLLSFVSLGCLLLGIAVLLLAAFAPVKKELVPKLCWLGLFLFVLMGLNSAAIYYWHHFVR